jgi:mannosyltransferase
VRLIGSRWATPALLAVLIGVSALIRTRAIDAGYWIDEGLSVGIADRPLADIPATLRQDGSPPLYYLLLHGWMRLVGSGETATHALSLVAALATIPLAYWIGRRFFGTRAGWACAMIAATIPFLSRYAQETRMYALVMLESLLLCAAFVEGGVRGRRAALPWLTLVLALLLYTHNWGVHLFVGTVVASIVLIATGRLAVPVRWLGAALVGALVLYAPWIPSLVDQARATGAPWSRLPGWQWLAIAALILAAGVGLAFARPGRDPAGAALLALGVLGAAALVCAFVVARIEPGWATRYLSILAGPIVLLAGAAVARTRHVGTVALAAVVGFWLWQGTPAPKSNARELSAALAPTLRPGDVVLSTQPEQVPVLAHYLPDAVRFMTVLGPIDDEGVMDWRDALARLRAASPGATIDAAVRETPRGGRVVVIRPVVTGGGWTTPWTSLVAEHSRVIEGAMARRGTGAYQVVAGRSDVANIALSATVVPVG